MNLKTPLFILIAIILKKTIHIKNHHILTIHIKNHYTNNFHKNQCTDNFVVINQINKHKVKYIINASIPTIIIKKCFTYNYIKKFLYPKNIFKIFFFVF